MAIRRIMRLPAVKEASGYESTSQIYALMAKGEFPRPVKIGAQAVGWYADEIEAWQKKLDRAKGGWSPRDRKQRDSTTSTSAAV
jgi:predicted DNA-binding transcriptional regulator AlpA